MNPGEVAVVGGNHDHWSATGGVGLLPEVDALAVEPDHEVVPEGEHERREEAGDRGCYLEDGIEVHGVLQALGTDGPFIRLPSGPPAGGTVGLPTYRVRERALPKVLELRPGGLTDLAADVAPEQVDEEEYRGG